MNSLISEVKQGELNPNLNFTALFCLIVMNCGPKSCGFRGDYCMIRGCGFGGTIALGLDLIVAYNGMVCGIIWDIAKLGDCRLF